MIPTYRGAEALAWVARIDGPAAAEGGDDATRDAAVRAAVSAIIADVAARGDEALRALAERFGDPAPETLAADDPRVEAACARLPAERRAVLERAAARVRAFGDAVMERVRQPILLPLPDCEVGLRFEPVSRAACYVPAGRYPLPSTAIMTAVTARAAGVRDVCVMTPRLHDEILYAGRLAGVARFHLVGGAQAVAAAALGTDGIGRCDLIVGPGNAYVTEAKRQLQGRIGIDMLAGPSEVVVVADSGADPRWVALDLLAQAEHDPDARAYLLTDSEALCDAVAAALPAAVERLALPDFVRRSLAGSALVALPDLAACLEAANRIAPEHLQLELRDPEAARPALRHYGALFLGDLSTVPLGDYMAGPNHTLPTQRTARFSGSLTPLTFLRAQSSIRATAEAALLLADTDRFAAMEGLRAHGAAAAARVDALSARRG